MGYAHGVRWDEDLITKKLLCIVETLGIYHFPTHSEMVGFYGNHSLAVAVSRNGGSRHWANKMNLPIKECESEVGNDFELYAMQDIEKNTGLVSKKMKPRYPYDIATSNHIKVDVKVSYPSMYGSGGVTNTFNLEKKNPTCDIFILYCLKENGSIYKTLVIPSCFLAGKTQVGVGLLSKWDVFENQWRFFREYAEFYYNLTSGVELIERRRSKVVDWSGEIS